MANCSCSEARSSTFAVAVSIRAHQASTLASDAELNPSSVTRSRATLGTILDGIVEKGKGAFLSEKCEKG